MAVNFYVSFCKFNLLLCFSVVFDVGIPSTPLAMAAHRLLSGIFCHTHFSCCEFAYFVLTRDQK
jgi:hypothetical protein